MRKLLLLFLAAPLTWAAYNSPATAGQIASGTWSSGGSPTGTGSCTITFATPTGGGVAAVATVPVNSGVITSNAALTITTSGEGYESAPTSGTGSGSYCSGTITVSTTLGTLNPTWFVYASGASDNSGGCFDSQYSGTNYANQTSAQVTFSSGNSNLLSASQNSTTLTSAGTPFTSVMAGNCIHITGGTNFVAGIYEITAYTNSSTVTLDRAPATAGAGSSGTGALGGAFLTLSNWQTYEESATTSYLKGSFTPSAGIVPPRGIHGQYTRVIGFSSTITDGVQAVVTPSASMTTFNMRGFNVIHNIDIEGGSSNYYANYCVYNTEPFVDLDNITCNNFATYGVYTSGQSNIKNTVVENGKSGCTSGFYSSITTAVFHGDVATGNPCPGAIDNSAASWNRFLSYANTGSSSHGLSFTLSGSETTVPKVLYSTFYNNGGAGIYCTAADSCDELIALGNIFVNNGTYGIASPNMTLAYPDGLDYNAYYGNTSGDLQGYTHGSHDACASGCSITLSGVPFASAATGNFALNSTSGQGAALKTKGWPGAISPLGLTTGSPDIGAAQGSTTGSAGQAAYAQ